METTKDNKITRPISEIAKEIRAYWKPVSPYAKPYLDVMYSLNDISDDYFADSGKSVVLYFLSNAGAWRGETAKRIKAELEQLIK